MSTYSVSLPDRVTYIFLSSVLLSHLRIHYFPASSKSAEIHPPIRLNPPCSAIFMRTRCFSGASPSFSSPCSFVLRDVVCFCCTSSIYQDVTRTQIHLLRADGEPHSILSLFDVFPCLLPKDPSELFSIRIFPCVSMHARERPESHYSLKESS